MDPLDLARWQFGITTVYHFIFVPLTIGLAPLVALMQTFWYRTGKEHWLRLTKFFGRLFLINFAVGVVTGIVQEFQFGMNWSEYSRFVGDVFGAPLAMEALAAFFIESTFIGLWIFGWDRLSRKVHLMCIWLVAFAVNLSAAFILAANSWMQHPVGATFNEVTGRAEMTDIGAVLTSSTFLSALSHTISASFLTAGTFIAGISAWWMVRKVRQDKAAAAAAEVEFNPETSEAATVYKPAFKIGLVTIVVSGLALLGTGDVQAKILFQHQPMKMAAAEALCESENGAAFSVLTLGDGTNDCAGINHLITIPGVTSFLAASDFNAPLQGVTELQAEYEATYGEGVDYVPNMMIAYWSFRLMMAFAAGSVAVALVGWWLTRKGRLPDSDWLRRIALIALPTPFLASSFGWIFTEMGRQPWIVAPNPQMIDPIYLLTERGVSTAVPAWAVLVSMIAFTVIYAVMAIAWAKVLIKYTRKGAVPVAEPSLDNDAPDKPLSFAY